MSFLISVKYTGAEPKIARRAFNNLLKVAYKAIGKMWHRLFRKKHFTKAGAREYRYTPRSGESGRFHGKQFKRSYLGQKLTKRGHSRPMIWSGKTKRRSAQLRVFATKNSVRVTMAGIVHLNRYRPKKKSGLIINLTDEMTRVSRAEARQLTFELRRRMAILLSSKTGTRVVAFAA